METKIIDCLEEMGFKEKQNKRNCWVKDLGDDQYIYWDFNKLAKGRFYVTKSGNFESDLDAKARDEYKTLRDLQKGNGRNEVLPKQTLTIKNNFNSMQQKETTEIGIVTPQIDIDGAVTQFNKFQELKQKLLNDNDFLYIGKDGRPTTKDKSVAEYIKKSGWRKFSLVFNLSCQILSKQRDKYTDAEGSYYVWTYYVKVTANNGRFQDAEGAATSRDPFFSKKGDATRIPEEKNIMLKAQTVAFNRAISDLIGGGELTAEEINVE